MLFQRNKTGILVVVLTILMACTNRDKTVVSPKQIIPDSFSIVISSDSNSILSDYGKLTESDTIKCNVNVLVPITKSLKEGNLSNKEIYLFLRTFSRLCNWNTEYSEYANELLFEILKHYPKELIAVSEKEKENIDIDYIIDELKSPVNDGIDVKSIYSIVKKIRSSSELKVKFLSSLTVAESKITP